MSSPNGPQVGDPGATALGLAQRETQRRISGICRIHQQQVMRLRADIAQLSTRVSAELPLDREEVVLVVGIRVPRMAVAVMPAIGSNGEKSMFGFG